MTTTAASILADLAALRLRGARRIRITVTADELAAIASHCTVTEPPLRRGKPGRNDGRVATFDGCGVFIGAERGYSWKP